MIARPDRPLWDAMHQEVEDTWPGDVLVDDHVLGRRRDRALRFWRAHISDRSPVGGFSCDGCPTAPRCAWAFDAYNTDGDCLAIK